MLLDYKAAKEIESHLYNSAEERVELENLKAEIAERGDYSFSLAKPSNSGGGDPTGRAVVDIERRIAELSGWVRVVSCVRERFAGTPFEQFLTMVYVERQTQFKVQRDFPLSYTTYYEYRKTVITYAALKACEFGVLKVR